MGPILGIAAGGVGDFSLSGHSLIATMAEARVRKLDIARNRGEEVERGNLAQETSYIRRRMSLAVVVAFGERLVSRISQVGKNGALASQRRQGWCRKEGRARLEREAAWLERVQGRSIVSRGRFWRGVGG